MNTPAQFTAGRTGLGAFVPRTHRPPQATPPEARVPVSGECRRARSSVSELALVRCPRRSKIDPSIYLKFNV